MMSWKDWLYISKSDKIAIIALLIIIAILLAATFVIRNRQQQDADSLALTIPEEYKQWQTQLKEQKEVEQKAIFEDHRKQYTSYQPKMKMGETIELNSADTTLLKTIPGIGSGYANRIVNYRTSLGGFAKMEQLGEVWGMDTHLYSQVVPFLTLNSQYEPIYINSDSFEKLLKHPYLNYKQVKVIEDIRTRKGAIKSIKRLELLDEFTKRDIERLAIYANFE